MACFTMIKITLRIRSKSFIKKRIKKRLDSAVVNSDSHTKNQEKASICRVKVKIMILR